MEGWDDVTTEYGADSDDDSGEASSRSWSFRQSFEEEVEEYERALHKCLEVQASEETIECSLQATERKLTQAFESTRVVVNDPPPLHGFEITSVLIFVKSELLEPHETEAWLQECGETENSYSYRQGFGLFDVDGPLIDAKKKLFAAEMQLRAIRYRTWTLLDTVQDLYRKVHVLQSCLPYGRHLEHVNRKRPTPRGIQQHGDYSLTDTKADIPFILGSAKRRAFVRVTLVDHAHSMVCISQGSRRYYIAQQSKNGYGDHGLFRRTVFFEEICYVLHYMSHNRFTDRTVYLSDVPFYWKGRKFVYACL